MLSRAASRPRSGSSLLVLVLLVGGYALVATFARCEQANIGPPSIATDGTRFTVAWDRFGRSQGTMYLQQFRTNGKAIASPAVVFRDPGLRGAASIVRIGDGYLALAAYHLSGSEKDYSNSLMSIPLDGEARAVDTPNIYDYGDELCTNPVASNDRVFVGVRMRATSHLHPNDMLLIYVLDRMGREHGGYVMLSGTFTACATAIREGQLALAFTRYDRDTTRRLLWVRLDVEHDGPWLRVRLDDASSTVHLKIVPFQNQWAVLTDDGEDRLRVYLIGAGGVHATYAVPDGVDPDSADLSVTERGLFVSWISSGNARIVAIGATGSVRGPASGRRTSATTALGAGDRCVTAWSRDDGKRVRLFSSPACP